MTEKPYTDQQVRAGADALVRLRTQAPSLSELTDDEQECWLADARAVLEAVGPLALVDDDPRHIIEFRPAGWTIKHPLSCRIGDLFGCRVNLAAEDLGRPPYLGRYEVTVDSIDGRLRVGDRVDLEATPPEDDPADAEADQVAVQNMLDDATRAFADAATSGERVEVVRDLLAGWYAAWPATAVTDEHEGIAHQLAALVNAAEARASELPSWVLELVRGLSRYEMEHPTLYRQNGDGTHSRWPCPEPLLELVPAEVRRQAEKREG